MSEYSKAKKEFQMYIRMRDADENGWCSCCTCGTPVRWNECDGGHFIPARDKTSTTFDERNCHAQCRRCNHFLSGNLMKYTFFMQKKYGHNVVYELDQKSKERTGYKKHDYLEIISVNKKRQKEQKEKKCL